MVRRGIWKGVKSARVRDLKRRIRPPEPVGGAWMTISMSTLFQAEEDVRDGAYWCVQGALYLTETSYQASQATRTLRLHFQEAL